MLTKSDLLARLEDERGVSLGRLVLSDPHGVDWLDRPTPPDDSANMTSGTRTVPARFSLR